MPSLQSRLSYPHWMAIHISIPPAEAAGLLALRELVDTYAYCADRRGVKANSLYSPPAQCGKISIQATGWSKEYEFLPRSKHS